MWFEDLSQCHYFPIDAKLIAVGWLERGRQYPIGDVELAVFQRLAEFAKNPWQPVAAAGIHICDLCRYQGEGHGASNLFVPGPLALYVCPELIVHYMNAHGYCPPAEFCAAVLACPPMRSMPYLRALAGCGGAALLRLANGNAL